MCPHHQVLELLKQKGQVHKHECRLCQRRVCVCVFVCVCVCVCDTVCTHTPLPRAQRHTCTHSYLYMQVEEHEYTLFNNFDSTPLLMVQFRHR